MRINNFLIIYVAVIITSCSSYKNEVIHADFCDFLNDITMDSDRKVSDKMYLEKTLVYVVNGDQRLVEKYLQKDEFIQREINNKLYYRIRIIFYKKSKETRELINLRSSRYLDFCNKSIFVEYGWLETKPYDTVVYKDGVAVGAKSLHIIQ